MIPSPTTSNETDFRRYQVLHCCLYSIKAWLDGFLSTPLDMFANMPGSMYSQLFYVFSCLYKVTITWNLAWVRNVVDLFTALDRVIGTFEKLRAARPLDEGQDEGFTLGVRKFRALKIAWQAEMASRVQPAEASTTHAIQEGEMCDDVQRRPAPLSSVLFGFHSLPDIFDTVS
jgi:hypothetical protein